MRINQFFAFARERHAIHLRRQAGHPRSQWTQDPILQQYRFTNVFRELDRTTVWFRENVRDPLRDRPEALLATVLFRWFNRITTGEAIFTQKDLLGGDTAWDMMTHEYESNNNIVDQGYGCSALDPLRSAIRAYCGKGPYVTGAYIIKTPDGMGKLTGVLWCVEQFMREPRPVHYLEDCWNHRTIAQWLIENPGQASLETVWAWLRQFPYMGDFMAYEVVTDLRHTALLERAPDIMTWANPGPGAMRGLNRVFRGGHAERPDTRHDHPAPSLRSHYIGEMRSLLEMSRQSEFWPQHLGPNHLSFGEVHGWMAGPWPVWEMRDVEHTLCEFDKYERVRTGEGRPRGVYR